ncbi:MAG: hypothetical protein EOO15_17430 [Chitinophagaceae bacterium]|nr:MAG: hypothetical protein EOO15_17430 [Chitinophagaceae bacterium]
MQEHLVRGPLFHGGIGNQDAETVLLRAGYQPIRLGDEYNFSLLAKLRRMLAARKLLRQLPQGATLVFQWPLYARLHRLLIQRIVTHRPDIKIVCYLTDINSIKDLSAIASLEEIRFFKPLRYFIAHNEAMRNRFMRSRLNSWCSTISFFDFLTPPVYGEREPGYEICFAGALDKSGFLRSLPYYPQLHFHLYGPGREQFGEIANASYQGTFPPHELPALLKGSFGLLWDGEGAEALTGALGVYARYISPHKLSLYILAGLPIICHEKSAAAELVHQHGIGFSVPGLSAIAAMIDSLGKETYDQMRANMRPLADRISTGQCLLGALRDLDC